MPEIFAPQLVLFVAGRAELALYREFIFPSVPARTGLLPCGIDDIKASSPEMAPMAIDIALRKAAVVLYDRGRNSRFPLDYVQSLRDMKPVVIMETINRSSSIPAPPNGEPGQGLESPSGMETWVENVLETLVTQIYLHVPQPTSEQISQRLDWLEHQGQYADLLLTSLALAEHRLRRDDLPSAVPTNPSGGVMARLRDYFGLDYETVIDAVSLRHDLLQHSRVEKEPEVAGSDEVEKPEDPLVSVSVALANVVRRWFGLP